MEDITLTKDQYHILARSSPADQTRFVLKHSSTFLITDRHGDIRPLGFEDHGLFHDETRFLSRLVLRIGDKAPPLLSSAVTADNDGVSVDLTNPDMEFNETRLIKTGTIYLNRSIFLWEGCYYEHLRASNYGLGLFQFSLSVEFEADFADISEVRGMKRAERGTSLEPVVTDGNVVLGYRSLDDVLLRTRVDLSPLPDRTTAGEARFVVRLGPYQEEDFYLTVACEVEHERRFNKLFDQAHHEMKSSRRRRTEGVCTIETSNGQFNDWIVRSTSDIDMMLTETRHGLYPYAGIPWYNKVFGRDGIITALETLWCHPDIARGVLTYLAAEQASSVVPENDAEPGKILHEERRGEMARLRESPSGRYYGTVDATPLFIMLAGRYYERTADLEFIDLLWPNIDAALQWIDEYGDRDKDFFVEYFRKSPTGPGNQGWKDSRDAVFHADGLIPRAPIALCEVQAYVYDAKIKAARMASALGMTQRGWQLAGEARTLRDRFLATFWSDELGTYALALDEDKRPCLVRSSNAGHCLFCGISTEEHARIITEGMMGRSFFTGWGVRTIATSEARYNPMSYHNGSVWPHDNALLALGMSRYNMKEAALKVLTGLFEATTFASQHRLPELFCGFDRVPGEGPTFYPVACEPQTWASAAVFLLLQACLGLSVDATEQKIVFTYPVLPSCVDNVTIRGIEVGPASADVILERHGEDVGVNVLNREGPVDLVIIK